MIANDITTDERIVTTMGNHAASTMSKTHIPY